MERKKNPNFKKYESRLIIRKQSTHYVYVTYKVYEKINKTHREMLEQQNLVRINPRLLSRQAGVKMCSVIHTDRTEHFCITFKYALWHLNVT